MWKEVITYNDMEKVAFFKTDFGCAIDYTTDLVKSILEKKPDCHFYYYKSDKMELLKAYREKNGLINVIAYTVKADIKDYPEAIRLMAEHAKEYIKNRYIKKLIIYYGSDDEEQMNKANIGVGKIGFGEFVKIVIEEYKKVGFKTIFDKKQITNELI